MQVSPGYSGTSIATLRPACGPFLTLQTLSTHADPDRFVLHCTTANFGLVRLLGPRNLSTDAADLASLLLRSLSLLVVPLPQYVFF